MNWINENYLNSPSHKEIEFQASMDDENNKIIKNNK